MKVNRRGPESVAPPTKRAKPALSGTVRERDMQRTIERLQATNRDAVERVSRLTIEVEALRAEVARLKKAKP